MSKENETKVVQNNKKISKKTNDFVQRKLLQVQRMKDGVGKQNAAIRVIQNNGIVNKGGTNNGKA